MANFITNNTNHTKELKNRLSELVKSSEEMKFLVGFFYFSGIRELYEGLVDNPNVILKILIGMKVDFLNYQIVETANFDLTKSDNEASDQLILNIRDSLSSDDFDTQPFYDQIRFFIQMIKDDRLLIRKTREPNHAKIYFFIDHDNLFREKVFITGSSNLTKPGLSTQAEFNVEIADYGIDETEKYFDDLWNDSILITEHDDTKQKLIQGIETGTQIREILPFEAYALVLKTYLDSFNQKEIGESLIETLEKNGYIPYRYQLDAVRQGLAIIEKNNGVIIADVVGLGKTVIACAIARELHQRGVVICPPALMGNRNKTDGWRKYLEEFKLTDWEVRSVGDLEATAEFVRRTNDIQVVIIDEVHRFRNQDTRGYEALKNICRDKIVIMLTATPFNNRPGDILSLIKLFVTPKQSSITLQNNLVSMFRAFKTVFDQLSFIRKYWNSSDPDKRAKATDYFRILFGEDEVDLNCVTQRSRQLADQIRSIIEPVIIRRNRLDLKNNPYYRDEVDKLSVIADPQEWFFELTPEQSAFYDRIIRDYFGPPEEGGRFKGAIYRPFIYETERSLDELGEKENFEFVQQRNLFDFMRRLMVKRFESSFGSFEQSIHRFKKITQHVLTFIETSHKYILDRKLLEKIYALSEDEIEEALETFADELQQGNYPKNNRIYEVDTFAHRAAFIRDIQSDLTLFDQIIRELNAMDLVKDDPKALCLLAHLDSTLNATPCPGEPERKVVIFSEYADTVQHLSKSLKKVYGTRLLVVEGNLSTVKIKEINQNFDASHPDPHDKYDILLSTDRISEGFNLNRAGMVINYDIPWNPVRVIQRVGRINRISKKVFEELYIVNFFPTEKGAELVKSRVIAQSKMFLIHEVLGEDSKIFDVDETPTPAGLFQRISQNPETLEEESFYTKMLNRYLSILADHPELQLALENFPPRVKVAKSGAENELLVFFRKGRLYVQGVSITNEAPEPYPTSLEMVLPRIECDPEETRLDLSDDFWSYYEAAKIVKDTAGSAGGPQSNELKAINNLKTLILSPAQKLRSYRSFLKMLLEDIQDYGTLSDFTQRRIANLEALNPMQIDATVAELSVLREELGEDYLTKVKQAGSQQHQEIIIAIENRQT